jgi:predicted CXXCH cytochrome family protein
VGFLEAARIILSPGNGKIQAALRVAGVVVLTATACGRATAPREPRAAAETAAAPAPATAPGGYVGAAACAPCHAAETALWQSSDHAAAMRVANDATVLGDFNGGAVTNNGVTTTFHRRDGRFAVRTEGADGRPADFVVAYTFGVRPLQQYLVEFPRGRYQALPLAWDTRPRAAGGSRWFHVYGAERIDHDDTLHWTGPQQNWNFMCAECHSTNLKPGYDAANDRFVTTWSEIDVACEACHGPGAAHVAWAAGRRTAGDTSGGGAPGDAGSGVSGGADARLAIRLPRADAAAWRFDGARPTAHLSGPHPPDTVIESCGRCHSRRGWIWEEGPPGAPLADTHRVALLEETLYHDDGQILGEVYEYGSFVQSRMHREGVICTDCHDPHSGRTRAEGNALCGRCHDAAVFDAPAHHHHPAGSRGASCVGCHMPARTYMVVDPRRDHSLRVPRPDLSERIGTPNACADCHADRGASWAAARVRAWYPSGRSGRPHYGEILHAGRDPATRGDPAVAARLAALVVDRDQPDIARATALALLPARGAAPVLPAVAAAVRDPSPLLRRTAAEWLGDVEPAVRARLGEALLGDAARTVRLAAAATFAGTPPEVLDEAARGALERAVAEYRRSLAMSLDRAETHFNLGNLERASGHASEAETEYRRAISLDPTFVPASVNLADLLAAARRDGEAERLLEAALDREPKSPDLHHALGLVRVRLGRRAEALDSLGRAAALRPGDGRYAFVYGVALHDAGRRDEAFRALEAAAARHPFDADIVGALADYARQAGLADDARVWEERLARITGRATTGAPRCPSRGSRRRRSRRRCGAARRRGRPGTSWGSRSARPS